MSQCPYCGERSKLVDKAARAVMVSRYVTLAGIVVVCVTVYAVAKLILECQ